jgi:epoxyqueuosine reductase QueG
MMVSQHPDSTPEQSPTEECPEQEDREQSEWFYTQRGETYGPVSSTELRAAAHLGFLGPNDLVCRKDRGSWIVASKIHGLFKKAR